MNNESLSVAEVLTDIDEVREHDGQLKRKCGSSKINNKIVVKDGTSQDFHVKARIANANGESGPFGTPKGEERTNNTVPNEGKTELRLLRSKRTCALRKTTRTTESPYSATSEDRDIKLTNGAASITDGKLEGNPRKDERHRRTEGYKKGEKSDDSKPDPSSYACSICGKCYATSSNLSRHKQTHRSLDSKQAKACSYCGKRYVSMPALAMHVLTHKRAHECHVCGKRFSRPWLLQGHIRSHTGERPFKCRECEKSFADRSNLRAHEQTHSMLKQFHCGRCNRSFALKSYLTKHIEATCFAEEAP